MISKILQTVLLSFFLSCGGSNPILGEKKEKSDSKCAGALALYASCISQSSASSQNCGAYYLAVGGLCYGSSNGSSSGGY